MPRRAFAKPIMTTVAHRYFIGRQTKQALDADRQILQPAFCTVVVLIRRFEEFWPLDFMLKRLDSRRLPAGSPP
jgi:hypothetical protein